MAVELNVSAVPEYFFAFDFEKNYQSKPNIERAPILLVFSIIASLVYLVLVYLGQAYMKNRPPYDLRLPLSVWNASLAVMSAWGTCRVLPELYHVLTNFGFRFSMCVDTSPYANPVTAVWYYVFGMSKFAELGDSVFVVLRKQRLMFLHWFHHSSVLIFTFFMGEQHVAMSRWFISMNFAVHSVMYTYYALRALRFRVPRLVSMLITVAQIVQMFAGFYISIQGYKYWYTEEPGCNITGATAKLAIVLYSFYFALFLNYFFKAYMEVRYAYAGIKKE